ncbi:MAG: class I SAM-dependent methyltransferase [Deltaproteobacteria bacterium]
MTGRSKTVQDGYDAIARTYHAGRLAREAANQPFLDSVRSLLPQRGTLVDLGCGGGVPVTRYFSDRGYDVTGYDLSDEMLRIAREMVPGARFERAAIEDICLPALSLDVVVSFFAIIHVERSLHLGIFRRIHTWLRPGGAVLLSLGARNEPVRREENWHGAPMTWSHFDGETNLELLRQCGFDVVWSEVEEWGGAEAHLFVVARKVATDPPAGGHLG